MKTLITFGLLLFFATGASRATDEGIAPRHRVLVSTDIGGTDFDDFQSLVHLLLYADKLDIEGLLSSPYGAGRKEDILNVIDRYEADFPTLKTYSEHYPSPQELRSISKQGETEIAPYQGFRQPTDGSSWLIECARRDDPRPLHILVWGGIEDLAQALHDAPDILPKLRVYFIGGPNKKWSANAYLYIESKHPDLYIIEANSTYRGWFIGGKQEGDLAADSFVPAQIDGHGELGTFFASGIAFDGTVRTTIRMGDSPSVGWLLYGNPADPTSPSWGGQFVKAWLRPHPIFNQPTTADDKVETYSVFELALPLPPQTRPGDSAFMKIENQTLPGHIATDGTIRFRFSPKASKIYTYSITSSIPSLDGTTGQVTSQNPSSQAAAYPSDRYANWWTDDPNPKLATSGQLGTRTVSRWREDFLTDFASRIRRCETPAPQTRQKLRTSGASDEKSESPTANK